MPHFPKSKLYPLVGSLPSPEAEAKIRELIFAHCYNLNANAHFIAKALVHGLRRPEAQETCGRLLPLLREAAAYPLRGALHDPARAPIATKLLIELGDDAVSQVAAILNDPETGPLAEQVLIAIGSSYAAWETRHALHRTKLREPAKRVLIAIGSNSIAPSVEALGSPHQDLANAAAEVLLALAEKAPNEVCDLLIISLGNDCGKRAQSSKELLLKLAENHHPVVFDSLTRQEKIPRGNSKEERESAERLQNGIRPLLEQLAPPSGLPVALQKPLPLLQTKQGTQSSARMLF